MKKIKLIPLMMIAPLLASCNGSGVKTMSKPKFAAYSNKVEEEKFRDDLDAATEKALKPLFVFEGDDLVSLDKGFTMSLKQYQAADYKATLKTGNKQETSSKMYSEEKMEMDAATLVARMTNNTNGQQKGKGTISAPQTSITLVGSQIAVILSTLPNYVDATTAYDVSSKLDTYALFQEKKMVEANAISKTYEKGQDEFDEKEQKEMLASQGAYTLFDAAEEFTPEDNTTQKYERYSDGNVFTSVFKAEANAITVTYSSGKELQCTSKIEKIYQINFDKNTCASSEEITIEMKSDKEGTYKYTSKLYKALQFADKKVSVKAPDLSKYTEVTVDR